MVDEVSSNEVQVVDQPDDVVSEEVMEPQDIEAAATEDQESKKARPGKRERQHQRQMRELQDRLDMLQSQLASSQQPQAEPADYGADSNYGNEQSPQDIQRYVNQAVQATLKAKQDEEQRKVVAQQQEMMRKQYDGLMSHLDEAGDNYEDFDDVVRAKDAPFTSSMRDAALLLPRSGKGSAAEVFYKLGKNREELSRLAKLSSFEQVQELLKLSRALEIGEKGSKEQAGYRPIDNLKNNPAGMNRNMSEDSPISEFKKRAREGWKGK